MDWSQVIRRQRMTRRFDSRPIETEVLNRILANSQKAPSAGFSQGFSFLVLEGADAKTFWEITSPHRGEDFTTPAVVIPLANKQTYLDRYSEPDKAGFGLEKEENWPVPFWLVDTSFASMIILLSATAEGVGCWFFGIFQHEDELLRHFGVPAEFTPIGAIALGYPAETDVRSFSLKRGRRPFETVFHKGRW